MVDATPNRDPLEVLADEFLSRTRAGENPSIDAYASAHPSLAEHIRDLFPTLLMMEECKPDADSSAESSGAVGEGTDLMVERLGDFQILREIGRGGMGVVYEAEQTSLGRHVALKVLPRQMLSGDMQIRRFEREARAAARLHHTNIVPVFGVGQDQGYHFYAMQFISGHGLDKVLDELKRLQHPPAGGDRPAPCDDQSTSQPPGSIDALAHSLMTGTFSADPSGDHCEDHDELASGSSELAETARGGQDVTPRLRVPPAMGVLSGDRANTGSSSHSLHAAAHSDSSLHHSGRHGSYWTGIARLGLQVAEALQHAHEQNILHRDIKPSNLLLDTRGTVWITDFGLAKAEDFQDLTHSGDIVGTLRYMAPECLQGKSETRSDIYSLGLTLYELAALAPAFSARDRRRLIHDITASEPPLLAHVSPTVPKDLATIIHKAIEREPHQRYAKAQDLADDLQRFLEDRPVRARRITAAERLVRWSRRNKALAASLLTTFAMLLLITAGASVAALREAHLREQAQQSLRQANDLTEELTQDTYAKSMQLAGAALQRPSGAVIVGRSLDPWRPATTANIDRRGWEWYYVASHNPADSAAAFPVTVTDFDWHPNGDWLAFTGCDGTVRIWKGGAENNIVTLTGHSGPVMSVKWNSTGSLLATSGLDGRLHIWKTDNWTPLHSLVGRSHVQWCPNAELLAVSDGQAIHVWDTATGDEVRSFAVASNSLLRWSRDGSQIAFDAGEHEVRLWKVGSASEQSILHLEKDDRIAQLGWSVEDLLNVVVHRRPVFELHVFDDNRLVETRVLADDILDFEEAVFAPATGAIAVSAWRTHSNAKEVAVSVFDQQQFRRTQLVGHRAPCTLLAWQPEGSLLATSGRDRTLLIWDTHTSAELYRFRLLAGGGMTAWSPNGKKLASASTQLEIFDLEKVTRSSQQPPNAPSFSVSPSGCHIALGHLGDSVRFWDLNAQAEIGDQELSAGHPVLRVAYSPSGTMLAAAVGDGRTIIIWDLDSRQRIGEYTGDWRPSDETPEGAVWLSWKPDSSQLAVAGGGGLGIHVVGITGKLIDILKCSRGRNAKTQTFLEWNRNGSSIVSLPGHHFAEILRLTVPGETIRLHGHEEWERGTSWVWNAAFAPVGNHVVTTSLMGTLRIWDASTGVPVRTLASQEGEGAAVCWSPDGHRIASGDSDGGLKIWDAASGRELLSLRIGEGAINQLAWTQDGSRIIAHVYGHDHLVILDANRSLQGEHVTAGLARANMELEQDPTNLPRLLQRVEICVRAGDWKTVLRDASLALTLCTGESCEGHRHFALRAALLTYLAHAQLGDKQDAAAAARVAMTLNKTRRQNHEFALPEIVQQYVDATTPFAWNVAAQRHMQVFDSQEASRVQTIAEAAVQAVPKCGQFRVTSGRARYQNRHYELACAELREAVHLFHVDPVQCDRRIIANIRMRLFRAAQYLSNDLPEAAEHIVTHLVLESLDFLTPESIANTPLNPITVSALDQYFAWFQDAVEARTWLYLAMSEFQCGRRELAREAFDRAESILTVRPDIDDETLAVWAEATLLIQP